MDFCVEVKGQEEGCEYKNDYLSCLGRRAQFLESSTNAGASQKALVCFIYFLHVVEITNQLS